MKECELKDLFTKEQIEKALRESTEDQIAFMKKHGIEFTNKSLVERVKDFLGITYK